MRLLYVRELLGIHDVKYLRSLTARAEVTLLSFDYREPFRRDLHEIEGVKLVHVEAFPHGFVFDPRGTFRARLANRRAVGKARKKMVETVRRVIDEVRPDVAIGAIVQEGAWALHQSGFHPWVAMPYGSDVMVMPYERRHLMREALAVLRGADMIIPHNGHTRRRIGDLDESLLAKTFEGPWGIDVDQVRRSGDGARARLGLADSEVLFFCRGFKPVYGPEIVLRAARKAAADHPKLKVLALGEGKATTDLIEEEGMKDRVVLHSPVSYEQMPDLFSSADVYVQANRSDGSPGAMKEGMACELPVVSTDIPSYRDIIGSVKGVSLVPVDDVEALAAALKDWLGRSPEERRTAGRENRERIVARYDWNRNFPHMFRLLNEAIRAGRSEPFRLKPESTPWDILEEQ